MPTSVTDYKIKAAKDYGANVVLHGSSTVDCQSYAQKLCDKTGATMIPPSGHSDIMIGQATVMQEFASQVLEEHGAAMDLVLVPSAGGGLLAGTGIVCQDLSTLVIGVEPEDGGANLAKARKNGSRIRNINPEFTTIAEGLRSPTAEFNWEFLCDQTYVHDVFGATDEQIKVAMRIMIEELKLVVEPSAAVALAVLLFNKKFSRLLSERTQWNIGIIISGGNTSLEKIMQLFQST
jgi:threonine dehydratase